MSATPPDGVEHPPPPAAEPVTATAPGPGTQVDTRDAPRWAAGAAPPVLPGYVLGEEIARGGMGVVYAARDTALDRRVAVKVLRPDRASDPDAARRFLEEARITARLQHPGVPPVHALGTLPDGGPFLAMKLIDGRTLAALLAERDDPSHDLPRLVGVFEKVCEAVACAHSRGVIHRDLKPSNVMVGEFGEVQVMDWGLAKELAEPVTMSDLGDTTGIRAGEPAGGPATLSLPGRMTPGGTESGAILGTPAYIPPEQARGEPADARADVFGLGAVLFEILTGTRVYREGAAEVVLFRAGSADLDDARARLRQCGADPELVAACERCLGADPADRPADAGEVVRLVAAYRAGVEARLRRAEAERAAAAAEAREQRKRRRVQLALAAAVGLLVLGGGAFGWWADRQAVKREGTANGGRNLLRVAADLRSQYRFAEADDALAAALHLAAVNGLDALRQEVEQARADLALVRQLDETRYRKWVWVSGSGRFAGSAALPKYKAALLARGFDLAAGDPADLAARVAASPVKPAVVAALADWALYEPELPLKEKLLDVARRADPGPRTDRLYDVAAWADPAKVKALADELRAAADSGSAAVAPHAVVFLADLMQLAGLDPVELLAAAQRRSPADFELNFALGQRLEERNPPRAAAFYQAARAVRPDNAVVLVNLGVALKETDDAEGAAGCFREAVRYDPKLAPAHFNLGVLLKAKGDTDGALRCFEAAVAADPTDPEAHNSLGILLRAKGELARAIGCYETAIRLDPKFAKAHNNLGNALKDRGELGRAVECYERAIAADGTEAAFHCNLGYALLLRGDPDRAVGAFREAVRLDRQDPRFRKGLDEAIMARDARVAPPPRPVRP